MGSSRRYEEAGKSCDRALALNPNNDGAWLNRGYAIGNLSHSVTTPLAIQHPQLAQPGYAGQLATYERGLQHCTRETHPEGWGLLHYETGRSHYYYARPNPYLRDRPRYFIKARKEYLTALETLTAQAFPEWHLKVLRDLARVYSILDEPDTVAEVMRQGADVLHHLLDTVPSPYKKRQLVLVT